MRKQLFYCDHCGKELDDMHDMVDLEIDFGCDWYKVDLCDDCWRELDKLVKNYVKKGL